MHNYTVNATVVWRVYNILKITFQDWNIPVLLQNFKGHWDQFCVQGHLPKRYIWSTLCRSRFWRKYISVQDNFGHIQHVIIDLFGSEVYISIHMWWHRLYIIHFTVYWYLCMYFHDWSIFLHLPQMVTYSSKTYFLYISMLCLEWEL